jgi:predicted RNA methylase
MVAAFLIIAVVGFLFYSQWTRYTSPYGAPYVPMEPDVVERIVKMAEVGKKDNFYDLGSGDGRVVIAAAMKGAKATGIETDWLRVLYSRFWIRLLRLEKRAKIIHGDIFKADLSNATVVSTYLLQETNDKLQKKLEKELKKGTRVVSAAFVYEGWKLLKTDLRGVVYGPLYLYKV